MRSYTKLFSSSIATVALTVQRECSQTEVQTKIQRSRGTRKLKHRRSKRNTHWEIFMRIFMWPLDLREWFERQGYCLEVSELRQSFASFKTIKSRLNVKFTFLLNTYLDE